MSHWRHSRRVLAASSPLLLLAWVLTATQGWQVLLTASLVWLGSVLMLSEIMWRTTFVAMREVVAELEVDSIGDAPWQVRVVKVNADRCAAERGRLAELLEDLSSGLGEGLLVVSEDLRIRLINRVSERFCGAEGARPGSSLLEIMRDPEMVELVEAAADGSSPGSLVVENPRGLWEVRAFPVRNGGAVVLFSDVSLVRRAAEFRRRFVQDLSHELRSPLAVMRTSVEAIEDELEPRVAEILVRQVERIDRLAKELHELATIETGQMELVLEEVELMSVVREVLRDFAPEAEQDQVEVRSEIAEKVLCVCDRRGLYRVLSNLVDNAIKYNRPGGWLEIRVRQDEDRVRITVADSGVGIPAGELKAVLQRFYRLDRARTPGQGGLGLGLAIVKHMVQQMGGSLELDSRAGVGTTVTVVFAAASRDS